MQKHVENKFSEWCDNTCDAMVKPVALLAFCAITLIIIAAGIAVPAKLFHWAFGG